MPGMTFWLTVLLAATPVDGGVSERFDGGLGVSRGLGGPVVSGSLDKELIRRVIHANMGRVRHCYEETLTTKPNAKGKVAITFTIQKDGKVADATVKEDAVGDEVLAACVARTVLAMTFPEPKGGGSVVVTYPFIFATEK